MTDFNKYNPYPEVCSIRCPKCQAEATFRVPFTLLHGYEDELKEAQRDPSIQIERWGGWYVIVHFPRLFPWKRPASYYQRSDIGFCICPSCGFQDKHELSWPDDAYFVCEVKGQLLWAWTRGHVQALKAFVASKDRKLGDYPGYGLYLHHIPKVFLLAKNREAVVRKLHKLLQV